MRKTLSILSGGALSLAASIAPARPAIGQGIVPQGFWILNAARSNSLNPGRQTLWVIKDDGRRLIWVSVMIDAKHRTQVVTFDGVYGGAPSPVVGTPMVTQIAATGRRTLRNFGKITGMGDYSENCRVFPGGKRFRCDGQVKTANGIRVYADDFDFYATSPPASRP